MPSAAATLRHQRVSPLIDVAIQGRFGADKGAPGVLLSVRHPLSIVTVIARKGQGAALNAAAESAYGTGLPKPGQSKSGKSVTFHWCGVEQWYAVAEGWPRARSIATSNSTSPGLPPAPTRAMAA